MEDYIEAKDFDGATKRGVRKVYYDTFMTMMKAEILVETDLYELEEHIHLPECMRSGLLNKALEMKQFDNGYKFMKTTRVHDIQRHLAKMKGEFRGICKEGERIVATCERFE